VLDDANRTILYEGVASPTSVSTKVPWFIKRLTSLTCPDNVRYPVGRKGAIR
jgi:hypothetical protein